MDRHVICQGSREKTFFRTNLSTQLVLARLKLRIVAMETSNRIVWEVLPFLLMMFLLIYAS